MQYRPLYVLLFCILLLHGTTNHALKVSNLKKIACGSICAVSWFAIMPPDTASAKLNEEGVIRFRNAKAELDDLDMNWDKVIGRSEANPMGLGDNVRRKLGTVYAPPKCDLALCSFESFTKSFLKENFEDIDMDTYEDFASSVNNALGQAEFLAYSANFNEFSSAKPADYVEKSHEQIKKARKSMGDFVTYLQDNNLQ